jgi:Fur family transcriptional regulator, peroxide stress response regulator
MRTHLSAGAIVDDTRKLFADHGLRCTKQRLALWDALCKSKSHPTAEELYSQVKGNCGGLSRATVYNTLEALCRAGLVRQMAGAGSNGCCRYDAGESEHLHFVCRDSRRIMDVPDSLSRKLLKRLPRQVLAEIEEELGVTIEDVGVQLHGRARNQT